MQSIDLHVGVASLCLSNYKQSIFRKLRRFLLVNGEELNLSKLLTESKTVQLIENNKKIRKSSDRVSLNRNRQSLSKIETVMQQIQKARVHVFHPYADTLFVQHYTKAEAKKGRKREIKKSVFYKKKFWSVFFSAEMFVGIVWENQVKTHRFVKTL